MTPVRLHAGDRELELGARTLVMGVLNVTPDSFSGDGIAGDVDATAALAQRLVAEGADIIDVGGESTRPNAQRVTADVELARVIPVIEALRHRIDVPVSVDTHKAAVADAAIAAGAAIVNDVWGLRRDPGMAGVLARHPRVAAVLMHNQEGTEYDDVVADVVRGLRRSMDVAAAGGVVSERIVVDPGFGFGKTPAQNLDVMRGLRELQELGRPILIGVSRKSTIGFLTGQHVPQERLEGGIALAVLAVAAGVAIIRTHDVAPTVRALQVADAVLRGTPAHLLALPAPGRTG